MDIFNGPIREFSMVEVFEKQVVKAMRSASYPVYAES